MFDCFRFHLYFSLKESISFSSSSHRRSSSPNVLVLAEEQVLEGVLEGGVAEGVAGGVDGAVDVAEPVADGPQCFRDAD